MLQLCQPQRRADIRPAGGREPGREADRRDELRQHHGPAPLGGVQDGGTANYQGRRIGIDTFADASARNTWLTSAAQLGVSPLLEGANWVAYWSVTSTA